MTTKQNKPASIQCCFSFDISLKNVGRRYQSVSQISPAINKIGDLSPNLCSITSDKILFRDCISLVLGLKLHRTLSFTFRKDWNKFWKEWSSGGVVQWERNCPAIERSRIYIPASLQDFGTFLKIFLWICVVLAYLDKVKENYIRF